MSKYGLQCFDANGNITLDVSDRLARVLGTTFTGAVAGSIQNDGFLQGTPYYVVTALGNIGSPANLPTSVSVSGSTLSWTYEGVVPADALIVYGVF